MFGPRVGRQVEVLLLVSEKFEFSLRVGYLLEVLEPTVALLAVERVHSFGSEEGRARCLVHLVEFGVDRDRVVSR